jgi:glutamine synthetase
LTALCSPTVNCYRRLHTIFAPSSADWGIDHRLAMIRTKVGHPKATYFENRIPGGSCNPYLVLAATIAAGIDGIVKKLECPPSKSATSDSVKLPESLSEAIEALENDDVIREALGDEFVRWFVLLKRQSEIDKIRKIVEESRRSGIDVERELYFIL